MKAISLWQPHASLIVVKGNPVPVIAALGKGNETRSRRWSYRGPLAIHAAAKRMSSEVIDMCYQLPFYNAFQALYPGAWGGFGPALP
jgi:hypothetical protein